MLSVYHTIGTMTLELREALRNRPFAIWSMYTMFLRR
jgi:hypothetical protein